MERNKKFYKLLDTLNISNSSLKDNSTSVENNFNNPSTSAVFESVSEKAEDVTQSVKNEIADAKEAITANADISEKAEDAAQSLKNEITNAKEAITADADVSIEKEDTSSILDQTLSSDTKLTSEDTVLGKADDSSDVDAE